MSKCKYLIDISPYDPLCDHPCRLCGGGAVEAECETCQYHIEDLERENEKLQAENKNLMANYEMLRESYMDSKQACEHLFTELKCYKSLLRAKLPERELMLIDEILKLRSKARHMYVCIQHASYDEYSCESCPYDNENGACDFEKQLGGLGIEVPK